MTEEIQYGRFIRNGMFISCILFSTDHMGRGQNASDRGWPIAFYDMNFDQRDQTSECSLVVMGTK